MNTFIVAVLVLSVASADLKRSRFVFMPDGAGKPHLVDLYAVEPRKAFDASSDVTLYLYTKSNPTSPEILSIDNIPSSYDHNADTRFIIHGWTSKASDLDEFRTAYLSESSSTNVVLVDWSGPASGLYTTAMANTVEVGNYVAQVINYLVSKGTTLSKVQVAGHSLGAHVAGITGYAMGGQLSMVTGMDPAGPLYETESLENRLDSSDAKFVQVIHTCGGLLGWADPLGHADFYPNGGLAAQPGCLLIDVGGICSHARAYHYFSESITSTGFVGHQCSDYLTYSTGACNSNAEASMGEHVSTSASGSYYLATSSVPPYALG